MFQSVALHDTLTFTPCDGPFSIACDDPRCPSNEENLVWRAADALWRAGGRRGEPSGVHVTIRKQIPIEAGLGGGSSDAAAALRALAAMWQLSVSDDRVYAIARDLGADVPFFFEGGTVLVRRSRRRAVSADRSAVLVGRADVSEFRREHARCVSLVGRVDARHRRRPRPATISRGRSLRVIRGSPAPWPGFGGWARPTPRCRAAGRRCSACLRANERRGPRRGRVQQSSQRGRDRNVDSSALSIVFAAALTTVAWPLPHR